MDDEIAVRIHQAIERDDLEEILSLEAEHGSIARVRYPEASLDSRKNPPAIRTYLPMMSVAYFGAHRILGHLLEKGLSVDVSTELTDTAIGIAIERGHEEIAAKMIPHSRNIDRLGSRAALSVAVGWGKRRLARLILEHGADPDFTPAGEGWVSPRDYVNSGSDEAMKRLFEHFPKKSRAETP